MGREKLIAEGGKVAAEVATAVDKDEAAGVVACGPVFYILNLAIDEAGADDERDTTSELKDDQQFPWQGGGATRPERALENFYGLKGTEV
jgi:hypothetical protein